MYKALYREYRPEVFSEILGQEHIIKILRNQLATDSVSHAYLFCGTRGTGKTTTARIVAKGLNCLEEDPDGRPCGQCPNCRSIKEGTFMDVIEIDAASNNGVENIRELRESVKYPPAIGRKKIYIIDEVHMLSTGAFNALLKTLEEPPEHVIFILATTEPQKLPATILSRCMRLDFKRVSEKELWKGMDEICRQRGIEVSEAALRLIAANADGSVRDGLSILDQCISTGQKKIDRDDILEFLGTSGEEVFIELTDYVRKGMTSDALVLVNKVLADGKDIRQFMKDWLSHYRALLISKFIKSPEDILNMSEENVERIREQAERIDLPVINNAIIELSHTMADAKWSNQPRILLELCVVKLATGMFNVPEMTVAGEASNVSFTAPVEKVASTASVAAPAAKAEQKSTAGSVSTRSVSNEAAPTESISISTSSPESASGSIPNGFDLEELWHRVFEEGECYKSSFNLIRTGTRLSKITDSEFVVVADNDLKYKYVLENKETLEELVSRFTGSMRRIKCITAEEEKSTGSVMDTKTELENLFGKSVDLF